MSSLIYCASFDIGKINFAFVIERFLLNDVERVDQQTTPDTIASIGELVECKRLSIQTQCYNANVVSKSQSVFELCVQLTTILNQYVKYWNLCDIFVIEQQMSFGKRCNINALKLAQHCWSYFYLHYPTKIIYGDFPAYHKTQVLGMVSCLQKKSSLSVKKTERKKWCCTKAEEILTRRNDPLLTLFLKEKKKDDISDAFCQLQAFKYLVWVKNLKMIDHTI